jgi:hypothetical protein
LSPSSVRFVFSNLLSLVSSLAFNRVARCK